MRSIIAMHIISVKHRVYFPPSVLILYQSSEINQYQDFYLWDIAWINKEYYISFEPDILEYIFFLGGWEQPISAKENTVVFASVNNNKNCQLEESLLVPGKGHFDSLIFSLNALHTVRSARWRPSLLTARAKHNEIQAESEATNWWLSASADLRW